MDLCKEQQKAMEVNVTLDVSSPQAKEKEHAVYCVTPDYTIPKSVDLESQSSLTLTLVRRQLNGTHIDSDNDNCSPQTPKGVVFDPFAPASEDKARAPLSRKYHEEARQNATRKLLFCSSTHHSESVSDQKQ